MVKNDNEIVFLPTFVDDHCDDSVVCDEGGFLDQNCECICPDGTSDCQRGKTRLNPGKEFKIYTCIKNELHIPLEV